MAVAVGRAERSQQTALAAAVAVFMALEILDQAEPAVVETKAAGQVDQAAQAALPTQGILLERLVPVEEAAPTVQLEAAAVMRLLEEALEAVQAEELPQLQHSPQALLPVEFRQ